MESLPRRQWSFNTVHHKEEANQILLQVSWEWQHEELLLCFFFTHITTTFIYFMPISSSFHYSEMYLMQKPMAPGNLPIFCRFSVQFFYTHVENNSCSLPFNDIPLLLRNAAISATRMAAETPSLSRTSVPHMKPIASSYANRTVLPWLCSSAALLPIHLKPVRVSWTHKSMYKWKS